MPRVEFFRDGEGALRARNWRAEMAAITGHLANAAERLADIEVALRFIEGTDAAAVYKSLLLAKKRAAGSYFQTTVAARIMESVEARAAAE
jgi:hypothetical protein